MYKRIKKQSHCGLASLATAIFLLAANGAIAGEITGNGKDLKDDEGHLNGKSECAFSGQQDNAEADAGLFKGDRTQSWGQLFKALKDAIKAGGGHPGVACNPSKSGG
jgi:hypothetical protein